MLRNNLILENNLPCLDIVLLGMGDDGHTASIFPDQMYLLKSDNYCEVAMQPYSGQKRITLTGKVINNSERIYFMVTGKNKAEIVKDILEKKNVSGFKGTKIEVEDLFYNTPVRRKFLKSEKAEDKKIKDRIAITAIANPSIGFKYIQNEKEIFNLKPESRKERIVSVFGDNLDNHLLEVSSEKKGLKAYGFISDPEFYKSNRSGQFLFVNGRPIEMKYSSYLLKKAYDELIPTGAHPWCFLFFEIDPRHIDVNVHPTKKEIRFLDLTLFSYIWFMQS